MVFIIKDLVQFIPIEGTSQILMLINIDLIFTACTINGLTSWIIAPVLIFDEDIILIMIGWVLETREALDLLFFALFCCEALDFLELIYRDNMPIVCIVAFVTDKPEFWNGIRHQK